MAPPCRAPPQRSLLFPAAFIVGNSSSGTRNETCFSVLSEDIAILKLTENGKFVERRRRKATGLREQLPRTAGLPGDGCSAPAHRHVHHRPPLHSRLPSLLSQTTGLQEESDPDLRLIRREGCFRDRWLPLEAGLLIDNRE